MDLSLDDYIRQNDFKKPSCKKEKSSWKFDRHNRDMDDDDEDDCDDLMDVNMEMPRLVPIKTRTQELKQELEPEHQQPQQQQPGRVPIRERLGRRDSITSIDSAITIQVNNTVQPNRKRRGNFNLKRLNTQNNGRISVQHRLDKNFVNPAIVARNNFGVNAINSFMESAMKAFGGADQDASLAQNTNFMAALATRVMSTINQNKTEQTEQKYNMNVQKEISAIQGKQMFFKCPGASVVSCDGPGLKTPVKIPHNETSMSLNQRFA